MLTIKTLNMAKVEMKQTPKRLNPYGEKVLKIWYDNNSEPPKNYIWCRNDGYEYWNGKHWEPWEPNEVFGKKHNHHNCDCCCDKDIDIKLEGFKTKLLESVLKLIKSQNPESTTLLAARIGVLESQVSELMQINHDLFVKNTELASLLNSLGYVTADILDDYATKNFVNTAITNAGIPRSTSSLINDSGFITMADLPQYSYDDSEVKARLSTLENANFGGRITSVDNRVTAIDNRVTILEGKPFDQYLTGTEGEVISASLNDLNDRILTLEAVNPVEQSDLNNYYTKQESDNKFEPKMIDLTEGEYNQLNQPEQGVVYNIIAGE